MGEGFPEEQRCERTVVNKEEAVWECCEDLPGHAAARTGELWWAEVGAALETGSDRGWTVESLEEKLQRALWAPGKSQR